MQKKEETLWHAKEKDEVVAHLESDQESGLDQKSVALRQKKHGKNSLPEKKRPGTFSLFFHQLSGPLIYLLLFAAILAMFIGEKKDAIVILVVVFINAIVGMIQEGRAERSLQSLKKLSKLSTMVLRNNKLIKIEASELVPGDIIELNAGDAVPADARLIKSQILHTTESSLTGESLPISKSDLRLHQDAALSERTNMLYAGTHVTRGKARAVVVSTGSNTEIGKVNELAQNTQEEKTLLEIKITEFGKSLIYASIALLFLVIGIGLFRNVPLAQISLIAIGQMVSLVPEGLPVAVTIALAVGVQRMARRGTIVRKLPAVEILGSTTIICTDKTGTLTRNEMVATEIYVQGQKRNIKVTGNGYTPEGHFSEGPPLSAERFFMAMALCNDAQLLPPDDKTASWHILGDPTEAALLVLAKKAGTDLEKIKKECPRIKELPFDSKNKMMATLHQKNGTTFLFIKGAPEAISVLLESEEEKKEMSAPLKEMSASALRVLAVAEVPTISAEQVIEESALKGSARLLGLVGELDLPRDEARGSIALAKKAGMRVIMLTGDHSATAFTIARSLGIAEHTDEVMDGGKFGSMSDKDVEKMIDHISVFSRLQPVHKLKIVEDLQKKGEVVAMTGDGVNDAPALMKANVGVAMGTTGTEAAKEASKIVITDDNFSTLIAAVSEGRLVYQNVKKLLLFLFVTSVDELLVLLLALVLGFPPPLAAVQILWLNLVTEGVLTINLIMEPYEGDEMQRPPVPRTDPLLDKEMIKRMPLLVLTTVAVTLGWFIFRLHANAAFKIVQSETFTLIVFCQWFNVLNCRSKTSSVFNGKFLPNPWLMSGLFAGMVLHACVLYLPLFNRFFHTVPLDSTEIMQIIALSSLVLWAEEIRKYFLRKEIKWRT